LPLLKKILNKSDLSGCFTLYTYFSHNIILRNLIQYLLVQKDCLLNIESSHLFTLVLVSFFIALCSHIFEGFISLSSIEFIQ